MPITLADLAKKKQQSFETGVVKVFLACFTPAEELPLVTNGSLKAFWTEEGSLPTVSGRFLDEAFTDFTTGHDRDRSAQIPIYGGYIDIDHQILSEPGGTD